MEEIKITPPTVEQPDDIKHEGQDLIDKIVALTFARHADLTDEEFLKAIGMSEKDGTVDEKVRTAKYNLIVAITKELLKSCDTVKRLTAIMKMMLEVEIDDKKGENK